MQRLIFERAELNKEIRKLDKEMKGWDKVLLNE